MSDTCVFCNRNVRPRQQAITCDLCDRWQHRICNTGIPQDRYRRAQRGEIELRFVCTDCRSETDTDFSVDLTGPPTHSSSMIEICPLPESTTDLAPDPNNEDAIDNITQQNHNLSFQVDRSFDEPFIVHERSLNEQQPSSMPTTERPLTFEIVPKGSQLGKDLLTDSHGYTYVIKEIRNLTTVWRCSVRSRTLTCPARVSQKSSTFKPGSAEHNHPPNPSREGRSKAFGKARTRAVNEPFTSSTTIVSDAMEGIETSTNIGDIRQDYLARCVNRFRQHLRPAEPKDIHFQIHDPAIPADFLRKDIHLETCRHLVFATDNQIALLTASKRWYIDGTCLCPSSRRH